MTVSSSDLRDLYRRMVRIRRVEETLEDLFKQGEVYGSLHLCIGQEATAVGACAALRPDDYLTCTYRGHGAELAKGLPLPAFMAEAEPRRRLGWMWGLAALAAAAALATQAVYRYRAELAVLVPAARMPLDATCRLFRCQVPLPRRPDLMSIETSDLQADARREGLIVLNAVLRNRARFPQDYPALELTLTDEGDRPLLRRVLLPRDYLDSARLAPLVAQGIAPGGEASLRVFLDSSRTRATGYRLYLFYPS